MVPRPATNSYSSSNNSTDNIVTYQWWLLFRIDIDVVCLCMMKRSTPEENTALFSELFCLLSLSCPFNMILNICQHLYCFISQFESDTFFFFIPLCLLHCMCIALRFFLKKPLSACINMLLNKEPSYLFIYFDLDVVLMENVEEVLELHNTLANVPPSSWIG